MEDRWICIIEPKTVLIKAGLYECNNCGGRVVSTVPMDKEDIIQYRFCPFCGKEKNTIR